MIQLFSIRMIRPVGFGYKDDNHVLSLYKKQQGGNIYIWVGMQSHKPKLKV